MPTWDQIRAPVERVLYIFLGYVSGKGWIASESVGDIATLLLAVFSACYGIYLTRPAVVAARAASIMPNSTIITSPEIAAATPDSPNVVSRTEVKAVLRNP